MRLKDLVPEPIGSRCHADGGAETDLRFMRETPSVTVKKKQRTYLHPSTRPHLDQVVRREKDVLAVGLLRLLAEQLDRAYQPHRLRHPGQPRALVGDAECVHAQHLRRERERERQTDRQTDRQRDGRHNETEVSLGQSKVRTTRSGTQCKRHYLEALEAVECAYIPAAGMYVFHGHLRVHISRLASLPRQKGCSLVGSRYSLTLPVHVQNNRMSNR